MDTTAPTTNLQCQHCKAFFTPVELQAHETGCPGTPACNNAIANTEAETAPATIDISTPKLAASTEDSATPHPINENTPLLPSTSPTAANENENTPQVLPEIESEVEPPAVLETTQDLINLLAGLDTQPESHPEHLTPQTIEGALAEEPSPEHVTPQTKEDVLAEETQRTIAGFCVDAPCDKVREILRLYSPANKYEAQKAIFNGARCLKANLIKTLQYLGETHLSELKKIDCAHKLHYRIQNLMPEDCGVCKQTNKGFSHVVFVAMKYTTNAINQSSKKTMRVFPWSIP